MSDRFPRHEPEHMEGSRVGRGRFGGGPQGLGPPDRGLLPLVGLTALAMAAMVAIGWYLLLPGSEGPDVTWRAIQKAAIARDRSTLEPLVNVGAIASQAAVLAMADYIGAHPSPVVPTPVPSTESAKAVAAEEDLPGLPARIGESPTAAVQTEVAAATVAGQPDVGEATAFFAADLLARLSGSGGVAQTRLGLLVALGADASLQAQDNRAVATVAVDGADGPLALQFILERKDDEPWTVAEMTEPTLRSLLPIDAWAARYSTR